MGYIATSVILLMLSHHTRQFILQEQSGSYPTMTGKRPAWMPQGRMGKRDSEMAEEKLDTGVMLAKKAAWVPQSRFGKRTSGGADLYGSETPESLMNALGKMTMSTENEPILENKRIPRMGLFEKRGDTFPRMGSKRMSVSRYLAENGNGDTEKSLKILDNLEKYFNEDLNFGTGQKRAAWVPQGRFGKRSLEDVIIPSTLDSLLNERVTKVMKDPKNPDARCVSVRNSGQTSVVCLRLHPETGELEVLPLK